MPLRYSIIILAVAALMASCDSKPKSADVGSPVPVEMPTEKRDPAQAVKPSINAAKTKMLAEALTKKEVGADWGRVELQSTGLLIHPGNTPTTAEFDIAGKFPKEGLHAWMVQLPPDVASNPKAGTAKITVFCDGKFALHAWIEPSCNLALPVNLRGVSELKIVVDNAGDGPFWDGLFVGVE